MFMYYYNQVHSHRFNFYKNYEQIKFHKNFKKLLNSVPNGIILLDKTNVPIFKNHVVEKMIKRRSSQTSHKSDERSEERKSIKQEDKEVFFLYFY